MKLDSIHLKDFRSHVETTLELSRLTLIRGANHVGKSSIPYALEYLLAGRCPGTASDGKGAVKLLREGAKKARIRVSAPDYVGEVSIDSKGARNGDDPSKARDILSCLTNTSHLYKMTPAEQKNLLSKLVLPENHIWPEWIGKALKATGLDDDLSGDLVTVIDATYKAAFEERTVVNRTLKGFVIPSGDTAAAKSAEDLAETEKKLAALREELSALNATQQAAGAARREHQTKVDAADDRLNRASAALSREEQELPAIKGRILSKKKLEETQGIASRKKRMEEVSASLAVLESKAAAAKARREELKKAKTGTCDKCQQSVTEETIAHMYGLAVSEYDTFSNQASLFRDELRAMGDPTMAQQTLDAHEAALRDEKRANERIANARKEVDDAKTAYQNLPAPPPTGTDYSTKITEISTRIPKGEQIVAAIKAANQLIQRQGQARTELAELEAKRDLIEKLVEEFGPKGLKARLLDENISDFQDAMNNVLKGWGYTCELMFEPFSFGIVTPEAGHRELALLSESEQHRFAVAFQVALALRSGYGFVVVDRADVLDAESRGQLLTMLWKSGLEQAIVCGTDERMEAKQKDGVAVYRFSMTAEKTTTVERLA